MQDFGQAQRLEPEAIGAPGQRTFRIRVMSGGDSASLWMEKEQLAAFTMAIRQLLEQAAGIESQEQDQDPSVDAFPDDANIDFKIGRLGIGYDESDRNIVIFAYKQEAAEVDDAPEFSCQFTRSQGRQFADRAEKIVNSGRPICTVCGGAIDPGGHKCLRRNGHSQRPASQRQ